MSETIDASADKAEQARNTFTAPREKYVLRRSREDRECFTWQERYGAPEPQCSRIIAAGERYMASTIFPGHDSGYADAGYVNRYEWCRETQKLERVQVRIPARPVTSAFCLPCCERWVNLKEALAAISERSGGVS